MRIYFHSMQFIFMSHSDIHFLLMQKLSIAHCYERHLIFLFRLLQNSFFLFCQDERVHRRAREVRSTDPRSWQEEQPLDGEGEIVAAWRGCYKYAFLHWRDWILNPRRPCCCYSTLLTSEYFTLAGVWHYYSQAGFEKPFLKWYLFSL